MRRNRRGNYSALVALGTMVFLGCAALAIDGLWMHVVETEAQYTADAGAHAALVELRRTGSEDEARVAGQAVMAMNTVGNDPALVDPAVDIEFGGWDFASRTFDPASPFRNAVRARVRRTSDAPSGPVDLLMMPIFGQEQAQAGAWADSTAAMRSRNVMVVQDVTISFQQEIGDAREADLAFLDAMAADGFPGDRLGMVTFTGGAEVYTGLEYVDDQYYGIRRDWAKLDWCDRDAPEVRSVCDHWNSHGVCIHRVPDDMDRDHMQDCRVGGNNTNQGAGLELGVQHLRDEGDVGAVKVIVLVTDGEPYGVGSETAVREAYGVEMADWAAANDVNLFVVSFNDPSNRAASEVKKQSEYCESLVRGFGRFYETPDASELPAILEAIARSIPISIVE